MATYIARDDFLKVKKVDIVDNKKIVGYYGQLALDEANVMYVCLGGTSWRSMTEIVANFSYASDDDVYNVLKSVDLREFLKDLKVEKWNLDNIKPPDWV